jgi:hypothetical protein
VEQAACENFARTAADGKTAGLTIGSAVMPTFLRMLTYRRHETTGPLTYLDGVILRPEKAHLAWHRSNVFQQ